MASFDTTAGLHGYFDPTGIGWQLMDGFGSLAINDLGQIAGAGTFNGEPRVAASCIVEDELG